MDVGGNYVSFWCVVVVCCLEVVRNDYLVEFVGFWWVGSCFFVVVGVGFLLGMC